MAKQSGERRVIAQVGEHLISLMVPDLDPELVQLLLSRTARSETAGHVDHEVCRSEGGRPRAAPLEEYVELLALIRDAGIDRAQLGAILGLDPETLPNGDDTHPPIQ